jgi:predicted nucleic acid-binding protein
MLYCIDTNVVIAIMRNEEAVINKLKSHDVTVENWNTI